MDRGRPRSLQEQRIPACQKLIKIMEIYDAILSWMNHVPFLTQHENFEDYASGALFIQILNHLNSDFFGSTFQVLQNQVIKSDWPANAARLKLILEKLDAYTHKVNDINVLQIAKDANRVEIMKMFGAIVQLIFKSQFQDEFVQPVLQCTDAEQTLISEYLAQLISPIMEQEDQSLLEKIDELEAENHRLQDANYALNEKLLDAQNQVVQLEKQLRDKDEKLQLLEEHANKDIVNEMNLKELEEVNKQLWLLQVKVKDDEEKIANLQNQQKQLELLLERGNFEREQLKQKLQQSAKFEQKAEALKDKLADQKTSFQKLLEDKEMQIQKLSATFSETYNQYQQEKKRCLIVEQEAEKLRQKINELKYEMLDKEQHYIDKIKDLSRRNSFEQIDQRSSSMAMQPEMLTLLSHELQTSQNELLNIHHQTLALAEDNYQREIELLREKNKTLEAQLKGWKEQNSRLEGQVKKLEQRVQTQQDSFTAQQLQKQNEQIQYLTGMINSFSRKYSKLREEYIKLS